MTQIASFSILLVPAAYVWWQGHELLRRIDDPAFAELRFANAQRLMFVIAAALATSLVISFRYPLIKLAILLLGILVARFPARRAMFEERWGLFAYLLHTLRFWFAMLGVWLLLALQPVLIHRADTFALPVAILIAATALAWHQFNAWILPWMLGAASVARPELQDRFAQVLSKANCGQPLNLSLDAGGGHWVNAFALPSRKRPAVLFTADLLDALTPAEIQAIFAHEVAHLEYFHPRRLIRRDFVVAILAGLPLLVTLALGGDSASLATLTWAWPLVVLGVLIALAAQSQSREHESDLRALELTGEAEPLIAALTKIHHLMKVPRRWRADAESRMSHPSLAKRLRAIRDAAAAEGITVPEPEAPPTVVARSADDPQEVVILAKDRLHWLHGTAADLEADPVVLLNEARDSRSIRYADLRDLRLEVGGLKSRRLIAVDGRGETLRLNVAAADVERLKAAIEHLDLKVAGTSLEASRQHTQDATRQRNSRLLGVLACLFAVAAPFSLPLLVMGVLVIARPARITLAATGVLAIAAGLLGSRQYSSLYFVQAPSTLLWVGELLLGSLIVYAAIRHSHDAHRQGWSSLKLTLLALSALAVLYLIGGLTRLSGPLPLMQLHLWARQTPGLTVVLLALGTALWISRARLARLPAAISVLLAIALLVTSTYGFRHRFGGDALAARLPMLATPPSTPELVREIPLAGSVSQLRLSPSGKRVAAQVYSWDRGSYRQEGTRFEVELASGGFVGIAAVDLDFLDDRRAAVLQASPNGTLVLRIIVTDTAQTVEYETALPALAQPTLRVYPHAGRWDVVDVDTYDGRAVLLSGDFARTDYRSFELNLSDPGVAYDEQPLITEAMVGSEQQALVVTQRYPDYLLGGLFYLLLPLAGLAASTDLILVSDTARLGLGPTALTVWCEASQLAPVAFLCAANDPATGTALWSVDAGEQQLVPIGALPGQYFQGALSGDGRMLLGGYGTDPVVIDLHSRTARSLTLEEPAAESPPPPADSSAPASGLERLVDALLGTGSSGLYYQASAIRGDMIALAFATGDTTTVSVFRLRD